MYMLYTRGDNYFYSSFGIYEILVDNVKFYNKISDLLKNRKEKMVNSDDFDFMEDLKMIKFIG